MGNFSKNSVYFQKSKLYFLKSKPYFFENVRIPENRTLDNGFMETRDFACEAPREGAVKDLLHTETRMDSGMWRGEGLFSFFSVERENRW